MPSQSVSNVVQEREELQELLQTPGWHRFVTRTLDEYQGRGFFARMGSALQQGEVEAKVAHKASIEIERALNWPKNRLIELQGAVDE